MKKKRREGGKERGRKIGRERGTDDSRKEIR